MRHLNLILGTLFCLSASWSNSAPAQDDFSDIAVVTPDKPFFLRSDAELTFTVQSSYNETLNFMQPFFTIYSGEEEICVKPLPYPSTPAIAPNGTFKLTWDGTADEDGLRPRNTHYRIEITLMDFAPLVVGGEPTIIGPISAEFDVMPSRPDQANAISRTAAYWQGERLEFYLVNRSNENIQIDPYSPYKIERLIAPGRFEVVYTARIYYIRKPDPITLRAGDRRVFTDETSQPGVYRATFNMLPDASGSTWTLSTGLFEIIER